MKSKPPNEVKDSSLPMQVEEATSSPPHPMVTVVDSSMQDDIDMDGVPNNLQTLVDH